MPVTVGQPSIEVATNGDGVYLTYHVEGAVALDGRRHTASETYFLDVGALEDSGAQSVHLSMEGHRAQIVGACTKSTIADLLQRCREVKIGNMRLAHLRQRPEGIVANLFNVVVPCDRDESYTRVEGFFGDDTQRVGNDDRSQRIAVFKRTLPHREQCLRHGDAGQPVVLRKGFPAYRLHVCRQRDGGNLAAIEAVFGDIGHGLWNADIPYPGVVLEPAKDFHIRVQCHGGARLVARNQRVVSCAVYHQAVHHIMAVAAGDGEVGHLRTVGEGTDTYMCHRRGDDNTVDRRAAVESKSTDRDQPFGQYNRGDVAAEAESHLVEMPHELWHRNGSCLPTGHDAEREAVLAVEPSANGSVMGIGLVDRDTHQVPCPERALVIFFKAGRQM